MSAWYLGGFFDDPPHSDDQKIAALDSEFSDKTSQHKLRVSHLELWENSGKGGSKF